MVIKGGEGEGLEAGGRIFLALQAIAKPVFCPPERQLRI